MLRLETVSVQFGMNLILDNVSFSLGDRERVAVVGRNGAGKTTLLNVAAGRLETDGGEVRLGKGQDIGFLEQERHCTTAPAEDRELLCTSSRISVRHDTDELDNGKPKWKNDL